MADKKFSELTLLGDGDIDDNDIIPLVDTSTTTGPDAGGSGASRGAAVSNLSGKISADVLATVTPLIDDKAALAHGHAVSDVTGLQTILDGLTNGSATFDFFVDSGAPNDVNGDNGDVYLNSSNGDLYKKASDTWGSAVANIKGAAGASGDGLIAKSARADGLDADFTLAETDLGTVIRMAPTAQRTVTVPNGINTTADTWGLVTIMNHGTASNVVFQTGGSNISPAQSFTWSFKDPEQGNDVAVTSASLAFDLSGFTGENRYLVAVLITASNLDEAKTFSMSWDTGGTPQAFTKIVNTSTTKEQSRPAVTMFGLKAPNAVNGLLGVTFVQDIKSYAVILIPCNGIDQTTPIEDPDTAENASSSSASVAVTTAGAGRIIIAASACQDHSESPISVAAVDSTSAVSNFIHAFGVSGTFNTSSDFSWAVQIVDPATTSDTHTMTHTFDIVLEGNSIGAIALVPASTSGAVTFKPNAQPTALAPGEAYTLMISNSDDIVQVAGDVRAT